MNLTREQIQAIERDAFFSGVRVADQEAARRHQAFDDQLEAEEGREKCHIGFFDPHINLEFVSEIAVNPGRFERIGAWYTMDGSDREKGCMRVIPGSHGGRRLEARKS